MNLLQKEYATITTQSLGLAFLIVYCYRPSETAQITHTGGHH